MIWIWTGFIAFVLAMLAFAAPIVFGRRSSV